MRNEGYYCKIKKNMVFEASGPNDETAQYPLCALKNYTRFFVIPHEVIPIMETFKN